MLFLLRAAPYLLWPQHGGSQSFPGRLLLMWMFCKKLYGVTAQLGCCAGPRLQCSQAGGITGSIVVCKSHWCHGASFPGKSLEEEEEAIAMLVLL